MTRAFEGIVCVKEDQPSFPRPTNVLINPATGQVTVRYQDKDREKVGAAPKPRLVHLSITPNGEETFSVASARHKAILFRVKVEIGGIAGMIAPLIANSQPIQTFGRLGEGAAAFVRADEALYVRGPIWSIQMAGPEWGRAAHFR